MPSHRRRAVDMATRRLRITNDMTAEDGIDALNASLLRHREEKTSVKEKV